MSEGVPHLAVRSDQVHDVPHHAEQCHHKRRVHARDHLRAKERHENPYARDADEEHPALPGRIPSESIENGVAELHRTNCKHADEQENPDERADRGTFGAEDVETGGHVVGQSLAKGNLAHEVGEDKRQGERDSHRHTAELAARVEGDDAAAHELGERGNNP